MAQYISNVQRSAYDDIRVQSSASSKYSRAPPERVFQTQSAPKKNQQPESQIKQQLRVIFMFYASFGDRTNVSYLKSNKFIKLIADAGLGDVFSVKDIDILYYQATKNQETLSLTQFYDLLLKIAKRMSNLSIQEAFKILYENHFRAHYEKIVNETEFGDKLIKIYHAKDKIPALQQFIAPLKGIFQKLHAYIFQDQSLKQSKVQGQYMHFLSSSDVIPQIINQYQAQLIFIDLIFRESILDIKSEGKYIFPLDKFIESLFIASQLQDNNLVDEQLKFSYMMDKIESSVGFDNFCKFYHHTKSESMQMMLHINKLIGGAKLQASIQQSIDHISQKESKLVVNHGDLTQYKKELKNIFQYYAQIGEPMNISSLKSIKFKKLLQQAEVMDRILNSTEADLIYVQVSTKKKYDHEKFPKFKKRELYETEQNNGKMNLDQFYQAIEMINSKHAQLPIEQFIEEFFLPMEEQIRIERQEQILQILVQILQDLQIIQLLDIMQNSFDVYYECYSEGQAQLQITGFMKFCIDFEVGSSIVSQGQLMHIFNALTQVSKQEYLDKHQFVEAIAIIGVFVYSNVPSNYQRVVHLLEKLTQTEGAQRAQIKISKNPSKWDLMNAIKVSFQQPEPEQELDFDAIVDQI